MREAIHTVLHSFSQMPSPLDLVKAPQQIKATLRRLEQVQGPRQNTATLFNTSVCDEMSAAFFLPL